MKNLFFISPYKVDSEYQFKKKVIKNACFKNNIHLLFAEDEKTGISLSAKETIKLLYECDFSIADLSFERPSCYYEIGFLQALKKDIYLISEIATPIHQVLIEGNFYTYGSLQEYESLVNDLLTLESTIA